MNRLTIHIRTTLLFLLFLIPAVIFAAEEDAKIPNPEPAILEFFGSSVDIHNNLIVEGTIFDDGFLGAAYVFEESGGVWLQTAKLPNPTPTVNDQFGASVAATTNVIVIGAPQDDIGAIDAGYVYTYTRPLANWTMTEAIPNPIPSDSESFGSALAIDG